MKKEVIIIFCVILLLNIILINSETNDNKVSSEVYQSLEKNEEIRVIVEINEPSIVKGVIFKTKKSDSEINQEKQEIKQEIKEDIGEESVKHEFDKEIAVSISSDDIEKLNQNPDVKSVEIDKPVYAFLQDSVPMINATLVWPLVVSGINLTGINETICIIDTGINFTHPDLIGKNKTCVIDCVGKPCVKNCSIADDNGHGTHVAGIAAASGGVNGVAIGVNLIGVKILNSAGSGTASDLNAGIDWCVNNSSVYNISVISMSLGDCTNHSTYCNSDSSASSINSAVAKNISVIVAAGNGPGGSCAGITNTDGPSAPACVENATAIGAVSKSDVINYQRGALFEIMAPGVSISSTKSTGGYETLSGTSMATPHAAGSFAIVRQAFRLLNNRVPTPLEIRNILNSTGKVIYDSGTGNNFSRINLYSAVLSLDNSAPVVNLISPSNNYVNSINNQTFNCNATDNLLLSNITFYLWNSSSVYYNYANQTSGNSTQLNVFVESISQGNYKWNCLAYDAKGNSSFASSNFSFHIGNISISLSSPANNFYTNQNQTNFNCSSTTASSFKLTNITLYIWNSTNSGNNLVYNETKTISGDTNLTSFHYNLSYEGNYSWNCKAYNNISLSAFAENNYSIFYDKTNPIISSVSSSVTATTSAITWITNENANSSINYGTAASLGIFSSNSSYTTSHSVLVSSLSSSTTYYYNITSCDNSGNCITNGTYSFTTSAAEVVISTSGSSGGGGGTPTATPKTYNLNSQQLSTKYTQELNKNDKIKFTFFDINAGEHTLTVNEIKSNYVNITIQSKLINLLLAIGQSARLNLTSADYYDIYIKLESIENNKAKITIQIINEEIPKPSVTGKVVEKENPITKSEEKANEIDGNINYLTGQLKKIETIIFMVVLVSVIIFIIMMIKKNIHSKKIENAKDNYKEKFKKEIKPRK